MFEAFEGGGPLRAVYWNDPRDRPVAVHLAVDLSYSMEATGKDGLAWSTVRLFTECLASVLPEAEILVYAFSEECRLATAPFRGTEVPRKGTDYGSFARTVLRRRRDDRPNCCIVFSDGLPSDHGEARRDLSRLADAGFAYTQVIFGLREDRRLYTMGDSARALDEALSLAAVETFDAWYGTLSN